MLIWPCWRRRGAAIRTESAASHWHKVGLTPNGSHRILFGRVQEDTALEASFASGANALCIASGGETAFDLLLGGAKDVVAIDVNPAQVLLVNLKATLFRSLAPEEIDTAFIQDGRPAFAKVRERLPKGVSDYFEKNSQALSKGLARAGTVDQAMSKGMQLFRLFVFPQSRLQKVMEASSLHEQAELYRRYSSGLRVKAGLRVAFHPVLLNRMFARRLGSVVPPGFSAQLRRDFDAMFTTTTAADNPYVWQLVFGTYPAQAKPAWLTSFGHSRIRQVISRLGLETGDVAEWLSSRSEPTLDLVCLSNVTDLAAPAEKKRLIDSFQPSLRPGATVFARSLFDAPIGLDKLSEGRLVREPVTDWVDRALICRNVEMYRWSPN